MTARKETKSEFCQRLTDEGRWELFIRRKKAMQAAGVSAEQAYWKLRDSAEFQPISLMQQSLTEYVEGGTAEHKIPKYATQWANLDRKKKKDVSMYEIARWVFDNVSNPGATVEDAPTMGAWGLMSWCRENPTHLTEFYRTFASRLMPSKSEVDNQLSFSDDGRKIFGALDKFEAAAVAEGMYSLHIAGMEDDEDE